MFSSSKNILITGGTFSQVNYVKSLAFEKLQDAASPAAFHNSAARFDPPKCHPNTRLTVLNRIMQWILGNEHKDELIMWLYGSAGAGKSAIAQSIAELCARNHDILFASFFFSRTDSTRNHGNSLFPTLAYQIASMYPEARGLIEAIVEEDPLVFSRSIEVQLESLVIGPLRRIYETAPTKDARYLIIIDGLDECQDSIVQCTILDVMASTLTQQRGRLPLIFLIASRPEQDITMTFNQISTISNQSHQHRVVTRLALDDSYGSFADIELFLRDKFKQIRTSHPLRYLIPLIWPSDTTMQQLVAKSSGQFIYASTVVNYVKSTRHRPMDRLEEVLGIRSGHDLPFAQLDALYTQILSSVKDIELVYDILALMMIPNTSEGINDMETFLFLTPGDILLLFGNLSSIIACPPDYLAYRDTDLFPKHRLRFLHASLPDFLYDEARSKDLFINPGLRYARLLNYCVRHLHIDPFAPVRYVEWHMDYFCSIATPAADVHQKIWNFSYLHYSNNLNALRDVVHSIHLMENFLSAIKKLKVDDAEKMYNHHLKQFDQFWMIILGRFFTKEDPKFDFLLLFAKHGLYWRVVLNSIQEGLPGEVLMLRFCIWMRKIHFFSDRGIEDPMRNLYSEGELTIDVHSPFWQFLEDPSRSGQYTINGAKYATAALVYFKCLVDHEAVTPLCFLLERSTKSDELVNLALHYTQSLHPIHLNNCWKLTLEPAIVKYLKRSKALPSS